MDMSQERPTFEAEAAPPLGPGVTDIRPPRVGVAAAVLGLKPADVDAGEKHCACMNETHPQCEVV